MSNDSVSAAIAKSMVASTARSTCRFSTRFVASTACGGSFAILCAAASAAASTSSSGHTWLASPISAARCALMRSPVNAYSFASSRLVCSGHVSGPPSAATSPTVHVRVGEVRRLGHVDDVGERDHAAAEADRGTVDRGDDRDAAPDHVEHELAALGDHVVPQRAVLRHAVEQVEVAAGRERAALAGDDGDARVGVGAQLREQLREPEVQLVVDRVELLGTRRGARCGRAVGLDADDVGQVVVHRGSFHDWSGRPRMRVAMMFFWICDVPPMTLCARL